jgi:hypothetical protein
MEEDEAIQPSGESQATHHVRLPGFLNESLIGHSEIGLGDAIKRATSLVGIRPCDACGRRAEYLNRLVTFSAKRTR